MKEADYKAISNGGVAFTIPSYPGHHRSTLLSVVGTREKQLLKNNLDPITYKTCTVASNGVKDLIVGAVSAEWI